MKQKIAVLVGFLGLSGIIWATDTTSIQTENLLTTQKSWDGKVYPAYPQGQPEATVLRITIPAHTTLDWHHHPVINIGYMLSGTLEVENRETGEKKTIRAGETLPELVETIHRGQNSANEPAMILVFYAGVAGKPVTEKAP